MQLTSKPKSKGGVVVVVATETCMDLAKLHVRQEDAQMILQPYPADLTTDKPMRESPSAINCKGTQDFYDGSSNHCLCNHLQGNHSVQPPACLQPLAG